jgi:hypothetical protein
MRAALLLLVACGQRAPSGQPAEAPPPDAATASVIAEVGRGAAETRLYSAEVADLRGDGEKFLVMGGFTGDSEGRASQVPVFARGEGGWTQRYEARWEGGPASTVRNVAVADLDGKPGQEIVVYGRVGDDTRSCSGQLKILRLRGETLEVLAETTWKDGTYAHGFGLAVGDLDGDGRAEIVGAGFSFAGERERGDLRVWRLEGGRLALAAATHLADEAFASTRVNGVALGDLDGDGRREILTAGRNGALTPGAAHMDAERHEQGDLGAWRLAGGKLERVARYVWKNGSTTRLRSVSAVDGGGDGKDEVIIAGQCDAGGKACLALLAFTGTTFQLLKAPALAPEQGEVKDVVVFGRGEGLRVATAGPYGAKPSRQGHVQLWKVGAGDLVPDRSWVSKNADETRARAILVWPGPSGPELITVGHALDGKIMVGQLLDWGSAR